MGFFAAGYLIVWLLVLLYTGVMQSRQTKLEREVTLLEELVQRQRELEG